MTRLTHIAVHIKTLVMRLKQVHLSIVSNVVRVSVTRLCGLMEEWLHELQLTLVADLGQHIPSPECRYNVFAHFTFNPLINLILILNKFNNLIAFYCVGLGLEGLGQMVVKVDALPLSLYCTALVLMQLLLVDLALLSDPAL